MNSEKMNNQKQKIYEAMKPYIDENGRIDIASFRKDNQQLYSLIPHYFGGVSDALTELNLVKITITSQKKSSRGLSLKDKLVLDYLNQLRNIDCESLESIAKKYKVTRPLVNQLHNALKKAVEVKETKIAMEEK